MAPIFIIGLMIVDDNMSVEAGFDELGKDGVSLTTCEEYVGFRC